MNQSKIQYTGQLNIKYKVGKKELVFKGHNEGLNAMFKYICKILSGNTSDIAADKPGFADIKAIYSEEGVGEQKVSCLYNTLSLTDPEYYYDIDLQTWVTRFTIVISYTMLNRDFIKDHPEPDTTYYIYLLSQSGSEFARMKIDSNKVKLSEIQPGTQAIVEWQMIIENAK